MLQEDRNDCGAACLAMVLAYYGIRVPLPELTKALGPGRPASALALLTLAEHYGAVGEGIWCDCSECDDLQAPAILHWTGNHFVVLEQLSGTEATIVDPRVGRRQISSDELKAKANGMALVLKRKAE